MQTQKLLIQVRQQTMDYVNQLNDAANNCFEYVPSTTSPLKKARRQLKADLKDVHSDLMGIRNQIENLLTTIDNMLQAHSQA